MSDTNVYNWSFRIFREENDNGALKYGVKRAYFNQAGELVDWDKDFCLSNDYESVSRMKKALEGMLADIEDNKLVLSNEFLHDLIQEEKDKILGGSGDIIDVESEVVPVNINQSLSDL